MTIVFGCQDKKQALLISDLLVKQYVGVTPEAITPHSKAREYWTPKILVTEGGDLIAWSGHFSTRSNEISLERTNLEDLLKKPLTQIPGFEDYHCNIIAASGEKAQLYYGDSETILQPLGVGQMICNGEAYQFDEIKSNHFRRELLDVALNFLNSSRITGKDLMRGLSSQLYRYLNEAKIPCPDSVKGFESYLITPGRIRRLARFSEDLCPLNN